MGREIQGDRTRLEGPAIGDGMADEGNRKQEARVVAPSRTGVGLTTFK